MARFLPLLLVFLLGFARAQDLSKKQHAKFVSIRGKLIPRDKVQAFYEKTKTRYVMDEGMDQPQTTGHFVHKKTGFPPPEKIKAQAPQYRVDPYSGKRVAANPAAVPEVQRPAVREITGKLIRATSGRQTILEVEGQHIAIEADHALLAAGDKTVTVRILTNVKQSQFIKTRIKGPLEKIPVYRDLTLQPKEFINLARRGFPFEGFAELLHREAVSPEVARKLAQPGSHLGQVKKLNAEDSPIKNVDAGFRNFKVPK